MGGKDYLKNRQAATFRLFAIIINIGLPVRSSCRTSLAARNVKRSCVADVVAARILPICGLSQHHIHHHHQDEADGKADRGEVGVGSLGGLLEYLTSPKHLQEVQDIDELRVAGPANLFIKPYDFMERTPDFSMKFGSTVTKL